MPECEGHDGTWGDPFAHCHRCYDAAKNQARPYPGQHAHRIALAIEKAIDAEPAHVRLYPDLYAHRIAQALLPD